MLGKTNAVIGFGSSVTKYEITFTVEGAKGDNISIADSSGEIVGNVIFDTGAVSKEHTMMIVDGEEYTFTSSVAKDIETGTSNYSKTVTLTKDTTSVFVFPSLTESDKANMYYWYGNEFPEVTGGWSNSGFSWGDSYWTVKEFTKNTNTMSATRSGGSELPLLCSQKVIDWTNNPTITVFGDNSSAVGSFGTSASKNVSGNFNGGIHTKDAGSNKVIAQGTLTDANKNSYFVFYIASGSTTMSIKAVFGS